MHVQRMDRQCLTSAFKDRSVRSHFHMCKRLLRHSNSMNQRERHTHVCSSAEPDWDAEMSLFRQRTMKPNQMQTVRRLEEEVDIGKVRVGDQLVTFSIASHTHCLMTPLLRLS